MRSSTAPVNKPAPVQPLLLGAFETNGVNLENDDS